MLTCTMIIWERFYPIKKIKLEENCARYVCTESSKGSRTSVDRTRPRRSIGLCQRVAKTVSLPCCGPGLIFGPQPQRCAYLIVRSSSWLLLFFSFFFHRTAAPPLSKRRNTIPPSFQRGPGLLSVYPPPASPLRSLSPSPAVLHRPQQLSLSFLHANPSGLLSSTPPLLSSSHLISTPHLPTPSFSKFPLEL